MKYGLSLESSTPHQFIGHCPYPDHRDSDPSFGVNDEKGVYHCYGCDRSGNLITFMMQIDGLSFEETLLKISGLSGYDLGDYNSDTYRAIHGVNSLVNSYIDSYAETDLAAGMSVNQFMKVLSQRLKDYERRIDYDPDETKWVDEVYAQIDKYDEQNDLKAMANLWDNLTSKLKDRMKAYKEVHGEAS